MALNFPNSPLVGDIYSDSVSGFSYEWNGTVWISFSPASTSNIRIIDDISGSFNGVTQSFALTTNAIVINPLNAQSLRINLGGVIQDPTDDYSISASNIIFSTAPESGLSFSGISLGPAVPVTDNVASVYERQSYAATAGQTNFNFAAGYTVGFLDVYQNGVRLSVGTDFTATNGNTFTLITPATLSDEIEAIGYKVATLVSTEGNLTNLFVSGISTLGSVTVSSGIVTATTFSGNLSGNATGLSGTPNIVVGIVTATSFVGNGSGLTGLNIPVGFTELDAALFN